MASTSTLTFLGNTLTSAAYDHSHSIGSHHSAREVACSATSKVMAYVPHGSLSCSVVSRVRGSGGSGAHRDNFLGSTQHLSFAQRTQRTRLSVSRGTCREGRDDNWRLRVQAGYGGGQGTGMDDKEKKESTQLYGMIERVFSESARKSAGTSGDEGPWDEIEGAWVLKPQGGAPLKAVVHFIGGAFVGASPQLTYRLFLESLADRGVLVIATPYASGFDHLRIADDALFRFDRCLRSLSFALPTLRDLPVYGMGHSMGALAHMLIGARYKVPREGNVLISFNNKEATAAIPLFSPMMAPMAQNIGPLLSQLASNPTLRYGADMALKQLRGVSPPLVQQLMPLIEQLPPLYQDLADGKDEFTPSPDETRRLVKAYYGVRRNLLVRFQEDTIDETQELVDTLNRSSAPLDLSLRTIPGSHARPLQQLVPEVPQELVSAVSQGGAFLSSFAAGTPFADLARGVGASLGADGNAQRLRRETKADIENLIDEIAPWLGLGLSRSSGFEGPRQLPTRF
eukprot:jgi/Mesen1/5780/ME000293S04933